MAGAYDFYIHCGEHTRLAKQGLIDPDDIRSIHMVLKSLSKLVGSKKSNMAISEEYQKWREMIFSVQPESVGGSKSDSSQVYGVIMDIGKLNTKTSTPWAISLSAFSSGEASFHATPGKAVIGLGGDPKVAQVAQEIIQIAQGLFPQTKPVQELSLPEPGVIQLFFLTTHGIHVVKDHMDQIQKPESPFLELTGRFHFIHAFADQMSEERHKPNVKALYAAAFTPEELNRDQLIPLVFAAMTKLKEINPTFDRRIQQLGSLSGVKMFSFKHYPRMYTLTTMQTIMKRVLKNNNVGFNPTPDDDFFVISNTDAQGNEEVFLLYFDIAW